MVASPTTKPWTPADLGEKAFFWSADDKWFGPDGWADSLRGVRAVMSGGTAPVITQIGGKNYVTLTGAGQFNAPFPVEGDAIACFALTTNANGASTYQRLATLGADGLTDYQSPGLAVLLNNGNGAQVRTERGGGATTSSTSPWSTSPVAIGAVYDGAGATIYANGAQIGSGTGSATRGPFAATRLAIGGNDQSAGGYKGGLRHLLVVTRKMTAAEIASVFAYFAS